MVTIYFASVNFYGSLQEKEW